MSANEQQAASRRRAGRGMLSSMERLPEACGEHLAWAEEELRERRMPQTEILHQFNARIADHGCKPISKGAFSRFSVRSAIELRKARAATEISNAFLERFGKGERNDAAVTAIELVKLRLIELIMGEDEATLGQLNQASLTLQRLTASSIRLSDSDRREQKDERDQAREKQAQKTRFAAETIETADTVEKLATEAGLSAERVAAIRRGVLGLAG